MEKKCCKVCVTGGAGYIGSWLVKKLLERGHVVHATLRNLAEEAKTGPLKNLPGADSRLKLFEADLYDAEGFDPAIQGCEFVFLVATPLLHNPQSSKFKDTTEASLAALRSILESCERSGSVKRVIYTGSVVAASPLKEDGNGFKDTMSELCWTPLNLSIPHCGDFEKQYTLSKTLTEKEVLSYNSKESRRFEIVTLACALVGGDALLPYASSSVRVIVSPLTGDTLFHNQLKFLQGMCGSVPLVHIDDLCEAHIFCMEKPSMAGRFLCASDYPAMQDFVDYYLKEYPELLVRKEVEGSSDIWISFSSTKLKDYGFKFSYNFKQILEESVQCAKRFGSL